jgi:hypothetical protein
LLIEDGLTADHCLLDVVHHVFAARATHQVPAAIPDPPPIWTTEYPRLASDRTQAEAQLSAALETLRAFWARTLTTGSKS